MYKFAFLVLASLYLSSCASVPERKVASDSVQTQEEEKKPKRDFRQMNRHER